jgi:hypothetical protein
VQHIVSFQPLVTAENITGNITEGMPYMQSGPTGIRKHIQHIILGLAAGVGYPVGMGLYPVLLPFLFNLSELIFHNTSIPFEDCLTADKTKTGTSQFLVLSIPRNLYLNETSVLRTIIAGVHNPPL